MSGWESGRPESDSPSTRGAVAGMHAREYLEDHPVIWAAIQAQPEHAAMCLAVSRDIRDHYAAAVVAAVLSVVT